MGQGPAANEYKSAIGNLNLHKHVTIDESFNSSFDVGDALKGPTTFNLFGDGGTTIVRRKRPEFRSPDPFIGL